MFIIYPRSINYHRKGLVGLGFDADEKMESVEIEGETPEAPAGNEAAGGGLAHGLNPPCWFIGFDDIVAFPVTSLFKEFRVNMVKEFLILSEGEIM